MGTITAAQIASYAYQAGFRGQAQTIAVAISLAESGGNTTATHLNNNGTIDRGLWQINSVHSQYNGARLLSSPLYNAQAAYAISSQGRNFNPWVTYTSGAYQQFMSTAQRATGTTMQGETASNGLAPWWTFPRVDNYGQPDSFGGFPKPDSNIQIPPLYPVVALLPGVVSGINSPSGAVPAWGASVTIRLDKPINSLATHTAYLHLASVATGLRVGSRVLSGQLIGYNGGVNAAGSQKVPLGFALTQSDNYGFGTFTPGIPALNPVPLLNAAKGGVLAGVSDANISTANFLASYIPILDQVHQTLVNTPGFYGIALALDEAEEFPGYIDLSIPSTTSIPGVGSVSVPDVTGIVRSIGATVQDNTLPVLVRGGTIFVGSFLLLSLLAKLGSVS